MGVTVTEMVRLPAPRRQGVMIILAIRGCKEIFAQILLSSLEFEHSVRI